MMRLRNSEKESDDVIVDFVCAGGARSAKALKKVIGIGAVMPGSNDRFEITTTQIAVKCATSHLDHTVPLVHAFWSPRQLSLKWRRFDAQSSMPSHLQCKAPLVSSVGRTPVSGAYMLSTGVQSR
jgi:hypothetical protein